jgi:hypothetical protein
MKNDNCTSTNDSMTDLFGEVIYSYTRTQSIDDGVLIDVSDTAAEAGIKFPVAVTQAVWDQYIEWAPEDSERQTYQDQSGRLWDVLWMARVGLQSAANRGDVTQTLYEFYCIPRDGKARQSKRTTLKIIVGSGDQGEGVLTILLPHED